VKIRGILTTAIYHKSLEINASDKDRTKSVTLMSTDCERIARGLRGMHDLWANVIQIALATWLIKLELGVACVAPIVLAIGKWMPFKKCLCTLF
jgi:ATP-binding cassette, subfamily C (CFTR/MRP), member 1